MKVLEHEFEPIIFEDSRVLILGSFPSVKSREEGFYYMNPRNRFWKVLGRLFGSEEPHSIEEKLELLKANKIALYDIVIKCQIQGSMDSDLKAIELADINRLVQGSDIKMIFANGSKAYSLILSKEVTCKKLPSTSPANARFRLDDLCESWKEILNYTRE